MALTKVKGTNFIDGTITDTQFANTTITSADMALDPRDADNFSSGSVPTAQLGNVPAVDTTGLDDDIAVVGFKVATNGSLSKYDLLDQTVDVFEDASGVDAGASTNETRNAAKYYSGQITQDTTGSNADTTTTDGSDTILQYTTTGSTRSFIISQATTVDYLVIAGGGGAAYGGGGGAGGYRNSYNNEPSGGGGSSETALSLSAATYNVIVGAGGVGNNNGVDSTFSTVTSAGGGYGGNYGNPNGLTGNPGGSGVGWGEPESGTAAGTGAGTANQGYPGSPVANATHGVTAGGGGGAGESGRPVVQVGTSGYGCNGGDGLSSSITGSAVTRAGGGGGTRTLSGNGGQGGAGGGGNSGASGTANTGGGAGAIANGGSGIVILRFPTSVSGNMTLVSTATTAQAVPTKGDMVMTYTNGAGTAVINTNIKGYVSRDGGTTYTEGTLVSQGTTGGHTIASFHDLDISGQPSGQSMKYKIETLVQSASMATRIQAVSLGWS